MALYAGLYAGLVYFDILDTAAYSSIPTRIHSIQRKRAVPQTFPRSLSDQYTEHTAAYISIQQHTTEYTKVYRVYRVYKTAYGIQDSIRHTRQHTTHHTNIPQHTCSLYVRGCSVFSIKTTVCFIWFCVWVLTKIHILTDTTDPY